MKKNYYLDHNATTPVRPEVSEVMLKCLTEQYGNPSSVHSFGREAREILEDSRERIAGYIGANPDEIFFTGCGTESDNIALSGVIRSSPEGKNGLVTTTVEHSAILKTGKKLKGDGYHVSFVGVDTSGRVNLETLENSVNNSTALVSVMHANNETGVIQDIEAAADIAHSSGANFHTDAVQSAGKIPINVHSASIDLLSMSGHKLNAPKGIGALYIRNGIKISPVTFGGSHERGIRPGTENVAGIVAFAKAFELAVNDMEKNNKTLAALRDRLEDSLICAIPNIQFNGKGVPRLSGTTNISIPGVDGEALLFSLDLEGIAVSTGSACTTGEVEPSHVLTSMGIEPKTAQSSLRFSMGWGSDDDAVDYVIKTLPPIVERLRNISGITGNKK